MQKVEPEAPPRPHTNGNKTPTSRERTHPMPEPAAARRESPKSWASRRADGPSWVEKIEQF